MLGANSTITVKRWTTVGKKKLIKTITENEVSAYIQPISPEMNLMLNGNPAMRGFKIFIDRATDIRIGDRITDGRANNEFVVFGVRKFMYNEIPDTIEIYANIKDENND